MSELHREIYAQLSKKFPDEAITKDNSRGFDLTSVKAQYVVERMNEVLGITGWSMAGDFSRDEKGVLYTGILCITIGEEKYHYEAVGFSAIKKNLGDSYKSARTDALSKAASWLGVANEVFKGNGNRDSLPIYTGDNSHKRALVDILRKCGISDEKAADFHKLCLKEEVELERLEEFVKGIIAREG